MLVRLEEAVVEELGSLHQRLHTLQQCALQVHLVEVDDQVMGDDQERCQNLSSLLQVILNSEVGREHNFQD